MSAAEARSVYAEEERIGFYWFFAAAWFAVLQLVEPDFYGTAFQSPGEDWWGWGKGWLFHGAGLALVGQAVWNQVSKRRFGKTVLSLPSFPAYPGETVSAVLTIPRLPAEFPGPVSVTAQCVEVRHREKRVNTEKVLWKRETSVEPQKSLEGWQAAVSVELPRSQPPTRDRTAGSDSSRAIRWRLVFHLPLKGMDLKRTYWFSVAAHED